MKPEDLRPGIALSYKDYPLVRMLVTAVDLQKGVVDLLIETGSDGERQDRLLLGYYITKLLEPMSLYIVDEDFY